MEIRYYLGDRVMDPRFKPGVEGTVVRSLYENRGQFFVHRSHGFSGVQKYSEDRPYCVSVRWDDMDDDQYTWDGRYFASAEPSLIRIIQHYEEQAEKNTHYMVGSRILFVPEE